MRTIRARSFPLMMVLFLGLFFSLHCPTGYSYADPSTMPWMVFNCVDITATNLLANQGFEQGLQESAPDWMHYGSGYTIDQDGGRDGGRALHLINTKGNTHGALQIISLNQTEPRPLHFSGWSKAENVTGFPDSDYSLYLDMLYTDNTWLYGQVLGFDTGSHGWQFLEGVIVPTKPVMSVYVYCLLRNNHSGTVWFDDLTVQEIHSEAILDGVPIEITRPSQPPYGGEALPLVTTDGLSLGLAAEGGAIVEVKLEGTRVDDPNFTFASGFFVRDTAEKGDFIHVGGSLAQGMEGITHTSTIAELDIDFWATYMAASDRITIHAEVTNTSESDRALTLYFALPVSTIEEWYWGEDIQRAHAIAGINEYANFSFEHKGIGASGFISKYPWACLCGPEGGIAMGVPLDKPCAMRLVYNPVTTQFYAAFDLGLSTRTSKFPNRSWVDLILYHFDGKWGFRAAANGYYERFPDAFTRRIPARNEGIWVAFTDLSPINNIEHFGIAFHEINDPGLVPYDHTNNILPFYYVSEPQTHWLPVNDSTVEADDHHQVIAHLKGQYGLPNYVINDRFEEGLPEGADGWMAYGAGYAIDPEGGRDGGRALRMTNAEGNAHGAMQIVVLNQTEIRSLYFGGWSKSEGISGSPDGNYSIYLDAYYIDGNALYGNILQFDTGTHDWQFREGIISTARPVKSVNVHCLLRATHSGTAWFDGIQLREVVPVLPNQLANGGFEDSNICNDWEYRGSGCLVDGTVSRSGGRSLKLANESPSDAQVAYQRIMINQTEPRPLYFSGWSKSEEVTGDQGSNYSIYLDIFHTDGSASWGHVLRFDTGTHDWQFREDCIELDKPIHSINVHCLLRWSNTGTAWFDDISVRAVGEQGRKSAATLSSGLFGPHGRYRHYDFGSCEVPWCQGGAGCNCYIVNPDPDIDDPDYTLNKAHLDWNEAIQKGIDDILGSNGGVYVDSFLRDATVMDFRTTHFAAADIPLTYSTSDRRVGVPEVFATLEFGRWVAQDVRNELGMTMMANRILRDLPWGADLFDVMGTEVDWLNKEGVFMPENDAILNYRRTLSFQRPYCMLMNTDFDKLTHELVERYFRICLFYGFYPSMFSHNAADDPYWRDPTLYNRDRDLFKRYVPLIRRLNMAGWQPVTYAYASDGNVRIERFGTWPNLHFTLRNASESVRDVNITVHADDVEMPVAPLTACVILSDTLHPVMSTPGTDRSVSITLPARAVEVLTIKEISEVNVRLSSGINLFGYPVRVPQGYTSYNLLAELGTDDEVIGIQRYDPNTRGYETTAYDQNGAPCGHDFAVVNGEGYLVLMKTGTSISLSGPIMNSAISTKEGVNILTLQDIPEGYTSYDLLSYLGSPDEIASIQRLDRESGSLETTVYYFGRPSGAQFEIVTGEAYRIHMKVAKWFWEPP